ncbi:MAG: hypothetical protein RIT14_2674 [Pseudomonadota bacterium]|jgi:aspartyl protease family protein
MDEDQIGRLIYLSLLVAAVGGWLIVEYRNRMGHALRVIAAWGLIFVGVTAGYGLWTDIRTDLPPQQMMASGGRIEIPRAQDGHYYVTLTINDTPVLFVADTGATGMVLSRNDAERLGYDLGDLLFLGTAQTANGSVRTARVTLPDVALGPYRDAGLEAWVNEGEMDKSLLGMTYLSRYRVEMHGDRMILSR